MRLTRGVVLLFALSSAAGAALLVHRITRFPPPATEIAKPDMVEILVASRAVAVGEMVGADQVRWQRWPRPALPAASFHRELSAAAAGPLPFEPAPARFFLLEGEPLSPAKLIQPEQGGALAAMLGPDMRAIAVPIREETAAGGFVQPNDRVDVIVTRKPSDTGRGAAKSEILARGAKVLAIGKALGGKAAGGGKTATLELTPDQARKLTAAQAAGEISLALIGAAHLSHGDPPTASIPDPVAEIRILKYGRSSQHKTLE